MDEDGFSEGDLSRTLDLADGYLDEAESVLWTATVEGPELTDRLENLTREVWTVQQQLQDLQAELEQSEE
jgi:cob(I)alamin adenosyltransferase